jgi:hypothetical protein
VLLEATDVVRGHPLCGLSVTPADRFEHGLLLLDDLVELRGEGGSVSARNGFFAQR